jgi:S1-C subfamily serine protease
MKVKSNIISFLLGALIMLPVGSYATTQIMANAVDVSVIVDGQAVSTTVYNIADKNYTSARDIAEAMGGTVEWKDGKVQIETPKTDAEKVAEACKDSCVMIYARKDGKDIARGSGFFYNGMIITAKHLLDYGDTYVIYDDDKRSFTATERIDFDTDYDIAAIKTDCSLTPVKLGDSDETVEGVKLLSIASSDGWVNVLDECLLGGKPEYYSKFHLQIHESIMAEGSSGGAVFNMKGELVGMIVSGKKNVETCLAVPSNEIQKLTIQ